MDDNNQEKWSSGGVFDYGLRAGAAELAMQGPQGDLWRACAAGDADNIRNVLGNAKDLDADARGPQGETPMMVAAASPSAWGAANVFVRERAKRARLWPEQFSEKSVDQKDYAGRSWREWLLLAQLQRADVGEPKSDEDAGRRLRMSIEAGEAGDARVERLVAQWSTSDAQWLVQGMLAATFNNFHEKLGILLCAHRQASRGPGHGRWRPPEQLLKNAAERGSVECLAELLAAGALPDGEPGRRRETALGLAVHHQKWDAAKKLVAAGANIEFRDAHRSTILMNFLEGMRSGADSMDALAKVLDLGANPLLKRAKRRGLSAIDIARNKGLPSAAALMTSWAERKELSAMLGQAKRDGQTPRAKSL